MRTYYCCAGKEILWFMCGVECRGNGVDDDDALALLTPCCHVHGWSAPPRILPSVPRLESWKKKAIFEGELAPSTIGDGVRSF